MKYHIISCIDDALCIAAEALHDREDWADRPWRPWRSHSVERTMTSA